MPREPKLSYLKCHRCRWDRQKCLPLSRVWPQRCDRCEKYNYECSESRLKSEKGAASLPAQTLVRPLPTVTQADDSEGNALPPRSFQDCIQDLSSWRILNGYIRKVYPTFDLGPFNASDEIIHMFLREKFSIIADARFTAKNLEVRGQVAEAAILLDRIENLLIENEFLFPGCNSASYLTDHILLLESFHDYASALILQERLIEATHGEQRVLSMSKLWQLYQTSSDSLLSSITRCLRKSFYDDLHAEQLEDSLKKMDPNKTLPPIHQVLLTTNNDLVSEAVREFDWLGAEDFIRTTALHCATQMNLVEGVRTLLNGGAHVNAANYYAETPLHIAAFQGSVEIVEMLLQAKADVGAIGYERETPLHLAAFQGSVEIVEILILAKSDVNKIDRIRRTPSHLAARKGHVHIVRLLQENGANMEIPDRMGRTPLAVAVANDQEDVATYLMQKGADLGAIREASFGIGTNILANFMKEGKFVLAKRAAWEIQQRTLTAQQHTQAANIENSDLPPDYILLAFVELLSTGR